MLPDPVVFQTRDLLITSWRHPTEPPRPAFYVMTAQVHQRWTRAQWAMSCSMTRVDSVLILQTGIGMYGDVIMNVMLDAVAEHDRYGGGQC